MTDTTDLPVKPPTVGPTSLGGEYAPFVYFDGVLTYGVRFGAIQVELGAHLIVPIEGGGTRTDIVMIAHLRCSPHAATDLRDNLTKALEMLAKSQEGPQQQAPSQLH
jgi:hypothetical protein